MVSQRHILGSLLAGGFHIGSSLHPHRSLAPASICTKSALHTHYSGSNKLDLNTKTSQRHVLGQLDNCTNTNQDDYNSGHYE